MKKAILTFLALVFVLVSFLVFRRRANQTETIVLSPQNEKEQTIPTKSPEIVYPVAEFQQRITKKPFGIFVSPENSPVKPERFTGYHTGVDIEYEDVTEEVPVYSVCNGEIELAKWVSGYGGLIALKCSFENKDLFIIYGHLNSESFTKNIKVKKGEQLAVLGEGNTQQTDFERKHLHFAISKNVLDIRGYVQNKEELSGWYDPAIFGFK